jgi:hypothetical protein
MTPHEFIAKWQAAALKEPPEYQSHSCDLCHQFGRRHRRPLLFRTVALAIALRMFVI